MKIGIASDSADEIKKIRSFQQSSEFKDIEILTEDESTENFKVSDIIEVLGDYRISIDRLNSFMKNTKVLCIEDPTVYNEDDILNLEKNVADKGQILLTSFPIFYFSPILELAKLINQSIVGEPHSIYIRTFAKDPKRSWWYSMLALWLFDEEPQKIKCMVGDNDDSPTYVFLKFKVNKRHKSVQHYATVNIIPSRDAIHENISIEIIGSKGILYMNSDGITRMPDEINKQIMEKIPVFTSVINGIAITHPGSLSNEQNSSLSCIQNRYAHYRNILEAKKQPMTGVFFIEEVFKLKQIIEESKESGKEIDCSAFFKKKING